MVYLFSMKVQRQLVVEIVLFSTSIEIIGYSYAKNIFFTQLKINSIWLIDLKENPKDKIPEGNIGETDLEGNKDS